MSASDLVVHWLQRELGATIVRLEQQPRWRPQWLVDVDVQDERLELLVRGDRTDSELIFPLDHEMRFQQVMHAHGIAIPKVYGWIEDLPAYVMERVPGVPGFVDVPEDERARIVDQYLQALVALHSLPVQPFVDAGIVRAASPAESGLVGMQRFEAAYRKQKPRPDPFLEFCLGWFHRHHPDSQGREAPIVWDSGQFHHHDGRLIALLDVELGHIGDPMMDLAAWRMRSSVIPFGDFNDLYERYAVLAGSPVDIEAIQLHHIAFTLSNQLAFSHALKAPPPGSDYATNLQWCNETNLYATEALAEYVGVDLPTADVPPARDSPVAAAQEHLVQSLRKISSDEVTVQHQVRIAFRLARHLQRQDEIGEAAVQADLDDLRPVLGHRPADWRTAERELEDFVLADATTGRHDGELIVLFHRRNLRAQMLNGPAGSAMARHNPIQGFTR